ncbi:hypothetical protein GT045_08575 [Streptomyces sp. SID486]|nr:hypothetical protein [Streptomyces sp. SID486]
MACAEIDRLRALDGFPESLRERVRVVGTAEGAALMGIPAGRFTRLARLGLLVPVTYYLNRYRTVVWLYLAEELSRFATDTEHAHLLKGRTPETLRGQLAAGVDLRARNWRGRHLGFLLRQAGHPWARAGAVAAFLTPVEVADVVRDPYERAHVNRYRPAPPGHAVPGSPSALTAERIMTAQDADEVDWLRSDLSRSVREARSAVPAPRPAARRIPPATRTAARPIPPMARTVTASATAVTPLTAITSLTATTPPPEAARPAEGVADQPSESRAAGIEEWRPRRLPGRRPELCVSPARTTERPEGPPARHDHRSPHPAAAPPSRGLRSWLRRRSPRTAGSAPA